MKADKGLAGGWPELEECRRRINEIDQRLLELINRRQETAKRIGGIKLASGLEVIDPAREQEVLRSLESQAGPHLSPQAIRAIYSEIISASRAVQEPLSAAYLGPEATFSHQAALAFFGRSTRLKPTETIEEVFGLVEKGASHLGIVPIENSFEGSVNITLDLFYKYDLKIGAETFLRIRNHLLTRAGSLSDVRKIVSHPMPIAQCRSWIRAHLPGASIQEVSSTSQAARMAAQDPESAAIGSRLSAETYGLNILEEGIEDQPYNVTRFLIIHCKLHKERIVCCSLSKLVSKLIGFDESVSFSNAIGQKNDLFEFGNKTLTIVCFNNPLKRSPKTIFVFNFQFYKLCITDVEVVHFRNFIAVVISKRNRVLKHL